MKRICKLISLSLIVSMITCVSINCFGLYGASTSYSVEVNFNKYYLCVGEQYTPSVTKTPSTLYVNWQSSNNSIAIVSNDGTITGVSLGNVTICLTYQNENSNTVLEEFDLLIVDTRGLENNTSYHIANCATGRLLAAGVEEPDDYGDVVVLRNEWTDKTKWNIIQQSNGSFKLFSFDGEGTMMKRFGTNVEVETDGSLQDEIFYINRVAEGDYAGMYLITNGDLYVTQSAKNDVYLTSTIDTYSYWSFMKVDKGYAEIFAFDYPGTNSLGQVVNFSETFYGLGYDSCVNINSTPEYALESMLDWDDVFVFIGHGGPGLVAFYDDYGESNGNLLAYSSNQANGNVYISELEYNDLSSVRCVLYLGCSTGVTYLGNNLVSATFEKGAHFVLGTTLTIYGSDPDEFLYGFLAQCEAGGTINDAIIAGQLECPLNFEAYGDTGRFPVTYKGDIYQRLRMYQ